jgi:hypothetical protein
MSAAAGVFGGSSVAAGATYGSDGEGGNGNDLPMAVSEELAAGPNIDWSLVRFYRRHIVVLLTSSSLQM